MLYWGVGLGELILNSFSNEAKMSQLDEIQALIPLMYEVRSKPYLKKTS